MSIEEQFNAAVNVIRSLPKDGPFQPSDELKLKFYAFYKQATEGPNNTKKPPFYDMVNRYKWFAWEKCADMSKADAMQHYVDELKKVIETINLNEQVGDFLDILGPFYEFLPEEVTNKKKVPNGDLATSDSVTPNGNVSMFNSYDSEGDEFTDTYDTAPNGQNDIPVISSNTTDYIVNGASSQKSIDNLIQPHAADNHLSNHMNVCKSDKPGHSGLFNGAIVNNAFGFNEQLTLAVFRLQQSLDGISSRVNNIEKKMQSKSTESNKWPLQELNPQTAAFIVGWPFVAYFLILYIKQFRKK